MKKRVVGIVMIVLALAAVAMGVLWQRALRDDSDMAALAQAAAGEAYTRFSDYQARGDDGDYWGGVAAFHTFQEVYACMEAGASQAANRTFCSEVYGALLLSPEQGKAHMAEVLDAVALRVAEKCGFVSEGVSRAYLRINGKWEDHVHMVLLNDAWTAHETGRRKQ